MLIDINCLSRRRVIHILTYILIFSLSIFMVSPVFSQDSSDSIAVASTDDIPSDSTVASTDGILSDSTAIASTDGIPTDPDLIDSGQILFKNYCAVCHTIEQQMIGPALAGVYEKNDLAWITAFIQNSQKVIQSGDAYAVQLYEQFNKTEMPAHDLSDNEVLAILAYVKYQTLNPPAASDVADTDSGVTQGEVAASGLSSGFLLTTLAALVVVLILILAVLVMLVKTLSQFIKQKKGLDASELEMIEQRFNIMNLVRSPAFVGGMSFIFIAIMLKSVIDGLYSVGIQQDYSPTQPIAYSHKVHAGDFEIKCEYCHTGVATSRSASIPSASVCMNCHSAIVKVTDSDEPSAEIQKIYDAIENDQPIEWVRIHNLPDLAYFNHAQHYKVGDIECQTCHGPIETMEVVGQYSTLTMGWCIDCHRETVLQTDNAYYDELVELHNNKGKDQMTVVDIGGLECSKCHY